MPHNYLAQYQSLIFNILNNRLMQRFCLFLCMSLLSSMFHAVAMPIETFSNQKTNTHIENSHHACDTEKTASPAKQCHLNGHICCLGMSPNQNHEIQLPLHGSMLFNSTLNALALQGYPYKEYKPPKKRLQS